MTVLNANYLENSWAKSSQALRREESKEANQRCVADATHGSLALKAYQQNLYLKYYY